MRHFIAFIIGTVFLSSVPLHAQEEPEPSMHGGLVNLHAVLTFPQGVFAEQLDKIAGGLGMDLAYAPLQLPVVAGLTGNLSWYDGSSEDVYVSTNRYTGWMPLSASGKLLTLYFFARMQPETGPFRPYAEVLGGLNVLWMDSSVDEEFQEMGFSGDNILTDAGLGYGAGGGIEYLVFREHSEGYQYVEGYVSLRVRYLFGGRMEYLKADAVSFSEDGTPFVRSEDRMRSDIEMLQVMVGFTIRL